MKRTVVAGLVVALATVGFVVADHLDDRTVSTAINGGESSAESADGGDGGGSASVGSAADDPGALLPGMVRAFTKAQQAAAAEGVELTITSGYRTAAHQQDLYVEAIGKYGSPEAAREWVLPPRESAHVRGEAIDVGPPAGAAWLQRNGVRFGLCQVYANEAWHFERLAAELGSTCPALLPHA